LVWCLYLPVYYLVPSLRLWETVSFYDRWEGRWFSVLWKALWWLVFPLSFFFNLSPPLTGLGFRMLLFIMIEAPRLILVTPRVRFERFAASFDQTPVFTRAGAPTKPPHRLNFELLYQYRPAWLIFIPIMYVGILEMPQQSEGVAPYNQIMPFVRSLGLLIMVETLTRAGAEVMARYFRLDVDRSRLDWREFWIF
jgi:hypothetical protein